MPQAALFLIYFGIMNCIIIYIFLFFYQIYPCFYNNFLCSSLFFMETAIALFILYRVNGTFRRCWRCSFYFSYRKASGSVTWKSAAKSLKFFGVIVCNLFGHIDIVFTKISADFSTVCIRPNVKSKSSPEQNIP